MIALRAGGCIALGVLVGVVVAAPGCQSSSPTPSLAETAEPEALSERDLADDKAYYASPDETVFLSLESATGADDPDAPDTGGRGYDVVPFVVDQEETLDVCADTGSENDTVELDQSGGAILQVASGHCTAQTLQPGTYELKVTRDPTLSAMPPAPIFVHALPTDGSTQSGPLPASALDRTPIPKMPLPAFVQPIPGDPQCPTSVDSFADPSALWLLTTSRGWISGVAARNAPENVTFSPRTPETVYGPGTFDPTIGVRFTYVNAKLGQVGMLSAVGAPAGVAQGRSAGGPLTYGVTAQPTPLVFAPIKGTDWSFLPSVVLGSQQYPWMDANSSDRYVYVGTPVGVSGSPRQIQVTMAMRAYLTPAGADNTPLGIGEVALTPLGPSYGYTYVINDSNQFPADFANVLGMNGPFRVRAGCNTSVNLYPGAQYSGQVTFVGNGAAGSVPARSARVVRTKQILVESRKCTNCNLARVNLNGYYLRDVQLNGVEMSGANLANAVLDGAIFNGVNLDGANLTNTSLLGATFTNVGFTNTDLRQTKLDAIPKFSSTLPTDACATGPGGSGASRLQGTTVGVAQLPPSTWKYLDLSDVKFDRTGAPASLLSLNGQYVCGSRLARASLAGYDLTNAHLEKSDLTGTDLSGVRGDGAVLTGATLTATNFTNAVLTNASLNGVVGSGPNFQYSSFTGGSMTDATVSGITASYATFTGVDFSRSSFVGTASSTFYASSFEQVKFDGANLSSAGMNYTVFTGGSFINTTLVQTSFVNTTFNATKLTGAAAQSANFGQATLVNVDLTGANFTTASSAAAPTSFEKASLCGTTLSATNFGSALLTGAYFAATTIQITPTVGSPYTCFPTDLAGAVTSAGTVCPSGVKPTAPATGCAGADWTPVTPPAPPCCVPSGPGTCKGKRPGNACQQSCDCASKTCASNICSQ